MPATPEQQQGFTGPAPQAVSEPSTTYKPHPFRWRRGRRGWDVTFEGHSLELGTLKGFSHIGQMLEQPNAGIPPWQVQAHSDGKSPELFRSTKGEVIDDDYVADLKKRLIEIDEDIELARERSDYAQQETLEHEKDSVIDALAKWAGLGRHRRKQSGAEKARVAVTNAIVRAIAKIEKEHPPLARYLRASISTGSIMQFRPIGDETWEVEM